MKFSGIDFLEAALKMPERFRTAVVDGFPKTCVHLRSCVRDWRRGGAVPKRAMCERRNGAAAQRRKARPERSEGHARKTVFPISFYDLPFTTDFLNIALCMKICYILIN